MWLWQKSMGMLDGTGVLLLAAAKEVSGLKFS